MELCTEMKLVGDTYGSGFGCGLTLTGSATIKGFEKVGEDPSSLRYENGKGLALTVHKRQEQDALRVWTEFSNHSGELSPWRCWPPSRCRTWRRTPSTACSPSGAPRASCAGETVYDLHLEPSWSGHGVRAERFGTVGSMPCAQVFPLPGLGGQPHRPRHRHTALCGRLLADGGFLPGGRAGRLTVTGGLADREFGHWTRTVAPGESFTTPQAVIAQGEDLYQACARLVAAQHRPSPRWTTTWASFSTSTAPPGATPTWKTSRPLPTGWRARASSSLSSTGGWYGQGAEWAP